MTIREHIDKLVKHYGSHQSGLYILERAFVEAHYGQDCNGTALVNGKLPFQGEVARKVIATEKAIIEQSAM